MSVGALCVFCTVKPSAGVAVTRETTPSLGILTTARPPLTVYDRTYVFTPSPPVVTVQPSSVVVAGSVVLAADVGAVVVAGDFSGFFDGLCELTDGAGLTGGRAAVGGASEIGAPTSAAGT